MSGNPSTVLYSTLLYSTPLYSTLLYSTLLYSTLLYSTLRYATLLYYSRRQALRLGGLAELPGEALQAGLARPRLEGRRLTSLAKRLHNRLAYLPVYRRHTCLIQDPDNPES